MNNEKGLTTLRNQVRKLAERIKKIEKRLDKLEDSDVEKSKSRNSKKKSKSKNNLFSDNSKSSKTDDDLNHNYLKKTIDKARKRYEREHK